MINKKPENVRTKISISKSKSLYKEEKKIIKKELKIPIKQEN